MKKPVSYYISELLFLHECVIVPEFGGFISNRKPAQLNKTTGSLTPPSTKILFNRNLTTNDGLLISHIATKENITQKSAKEIVLLFVEKSNKKLTGSKILRLEKIGLFTLGEQENITYTQDNSINYNLDSFGLKPTYNKLIARSEKTETEVTKTFQAITTKNINPKIFLRAVAVLIPLITISYLSISQQENINAAYEQMANLNPFDSNKITETISMRNSTKLIDIKPNFDESSAIIAENKKTYYIIAGVFAVEQNANRMLEKLNSWNYNALIIKEQNLLRVSYNSFKNRKDAVVALNKIKKQNPEAWLLTK